MDLMGDEAIRKNNLFRYQSNNWLKMHGKVMRRKPFKRKRRKRNQIADAMD